MRYKFTAILGALVVGMLLLCACTSTPKTSLIDAAGNSFTNGTFCAQINYYNPKTGKSATYTLPVVVVGGRLTTIHWPNGGWLDNSHFTPPDITKGNTSFSTNKGQHYIVSIIGNETTCP